MRLADLIERIMDKLQDPSLDSKRIRRMINEIIDQAASTIPVPLPDLETFDTVTTHITRAYISMPDDFHRDLDFCYSAAQNDKIKIYGSVQYLRMQDDNQGMNRSGIIHGVARAGKRLYYQRIPTTADTLTLWYYRKPTELLKDNDEPSEFPSFCHEPVIVNGVLAELFSMIEDGIEGQKINTEYHKTKQKEALYDLEMFIGPKKDEPPIINDLLGGIMY